MLRIEDTDRARSTEPAVEAILKGLEWLGIDWDGEAISQFTRADRHAEAAKSLLATGRAYYCYATKEELEAMRSEQQAKGLSPATMAAGGIATLPKRHLAFSPCCA